MSTRVGSHRRSRRRLGVIVVGTALALVGGVWGGVALAAGDKPTQPVCVPGTLGPDGHFVIDCAVPVPSASTVTVPVPTTVTQTVTGAPSPSSSSPSSTPPSGTPKPSTSTPTSTPTGTPTKTTSTPPSTPAGGCMAKPSACGWPDQTNTGVPAGKTLQVRQGDVTVSTPGTVLDGLDIRGCLIINADNVTVRNSRIGAGGGCTWYVVRSFGRSNVVIEDTEIVLSGWETKGIAFDGYTARRVWFHGGADCAHMGNNVTIVDSFCDIPAGGPADGPHYDGFQSDGGRNLVMRHNTIRVPYAQTSAILMSTNTSPITDVTIVDNLVAGGGYSIYCGTDTGGAVRGTLTFSGNVVAKTFFSSGGRWGPTTSCPTSGWRWDS